MSCVLEGDEELRRKPHITQKLLSVRQLLSTNIPCRVLVPTLTECYDTLLAENYVSHGIDEIPQNSMFKIKGTNWYNIDQPIYPYQTYIFSSNDYKSRGLNKRSHYQHECAKVLGLECPSTIHLSLWTVLLMQLVLMFICHNRSLYVFFQNSIPSLMSILSEHIEKMGKHDLANQSTALITFFCHAMDIRNADHIEVKI